MTTRYFVGLDLGQAADFSALAVLGRPQVPPGAPPSGRRPAYALRHLERFALGTPYPQVADAVVALLQRPPLPGCVLVVDQTGVGRPVVEVLAERMRGAVTCRLCPVTITAGHAPSVGEGGLRVPKKELVGGLQALLQTRRLQIARGLPGAHLLVRELENFRVKITATAHEQFGTWRESDHDDLVLAVALAAWAGEAALRGGGA